jgi:hypothetical protein
VLFCPSLFTTVSRDIPQLIRNRSLLTTHLNTPIVPNMADPSANLAVLGDNGSLLSMLPVTARKGRKYHPYERKHGDILANRYWRTSSPWAVSMDDWRRYLKNHHFYFKKPDNIAKLAARAERCARGRPSYDGRYLKELKALARERSLGRVLERQAATHEQLVEGLEAADDAADALEALRQFPKFLQLPPELRNRVHVHYFKSLGQVPPRFVLLPLCRASRQLRTEATGLFFEHSTFIVSLRSFRQPLSARLYYSTELSRINIPTSIFARIKHLYIELRDDPRESLKGGWVIDLTNSECVYSETSKGSRNIRALVRSIMARDGISKLRKDDLDEFEAAVGKDRLTRADVVQH